MGHILAFLDRRTHDRPLDGQKLVGKPGFVGQVQFLLQTPVIGEQAAEMHQRNAE